MQSKILFRTSGGRAKKTQLGMGHIYRCINLAKSLKNFDKYFLIEDYGGVKLVLREKNLKKIKTIPKKISIETDLELTKKFILNNHIDVLVIDKFEIKSKYVNELKKIVKVVVISDLYKIDFKANLVINGFIGFDNKIENKDFNTKILLGPKYQILNKKFSKKQTSKKLFDLLVTFGGFDENHIVEKILGGLIKYRKHIKIKIILGPASTKSKKISKIKKEFSELMIVDKVDDLYSDISSSKFGICGGGITTYEFESLGVPFAIICQHQHQKITAGEWNKRKIAKNLGFPNDNINKKIEKLIQEVFSNNNPIKKKQHKIVDGKGVLRVSKEISRMIEKKRK